MKRRHRQRQKNRIYIFFAGIVLCAGLLYVSILYFPEYFTNDKSQSGIDIAITDSFDIADNQDAVDAVQPDAILSSAQYDKDHLPVSASLDVSYINQLPELPTGCEITSLTAALNHLGFDLDKEDLIEDYLDYSYEVDDGIFMNYFFGSPYDPDACGCFAPALSTVANNFLEDMNSNYRAYNISYAEPRTLFAAVASGIPVIVWTSLDYSYRDITYQTVFTTDNHTIDWPVYEHCVVLTGYDLDKETVTFTDPLYGYVSHSIDDFTYFYSKFYYQAIVIQS